MNRKIFKQNKSIKLNKDFNKKRGLYFGGAFAIIGAVVLVNSFAATNSNTAEGESSNNSTNTSVLSDSNASGGSYIQFNATSSELGYTWDNLKVGAGGWMTGISMSDDGVTKLARTDVYGAYRLENNTWKMSVDAGTLPASAKIPESSDGVHEIEVAPSNNQIAYMMRGYNQYVGYYASQTPDGKLYRSNDGGKTWNDTPLNNLYLTPNGYFRTLSDKMAVDPINANVVFVGTANKGLQISSDGGNSFTKAPGIPDSTPNPDNFGYEPRGAGVTGITFDRSGPKVNGRTQRAVLSSFKSGMYLTSNGGASWQNIGGPSSASDTAIGPTGDIFVVSYEKVSYYSGGNLWRYRNNTWQQLTVPASVSASQMHNVVTHPTNPNRVYAFHAGGGFYFSDNGGDSWSERTTKTPLIANDVPWIRDNGGWLSIGEAMLDPQNPNKLWMSMGIGVVTADLSTIPADGIQYTSVSAGIENLATRDVIHLQASDNLILAADDRGFITKPDPQTSNNYISRYEPNSFTHGFDVDASGFDSNYVVGTRGYGGYTGAPKISVSTNGGVSWSETPTVPIGATTESAWGGGMVAVSTPGNFVLIPVHSGTPVYTKDGGQTWSTITDFQTVKLCARYYGEKSELNHNYTRRRFVITADRVTQGVFYLYHPCDGIYRSTNGGANWTVMHDPIPGLNIDVFSATLKSVPGKAGHLWYTPGQETSNDQINAKNAIDTRRKLWRSTDGGVTWTSSPGIEEPQAFGFGKAQNPGGYPTIFVAGYYNGDYGIFRSTNEGVNWTKIANYPLNYMGSFNALEGDMNDFGKVYAATGGYGWLWGKPQ